METSPTDVLIIGGGPTGLMLGCQLSLYPNVSFRIIDKNSTSTEQSRALIVHARSLELFAQLNLIESALSVGKITDTIKGFFRGYCQFTIGFTRIRNEQRFPLTRYPFLLLLEQSITEKILETYLIDHNKKVERNTEAIDIRNINLNGNEFVQVTLSTGEIIRTKYLCACDGARSLVRHKLNLKFEGRTYNELLFLLDGQVDNAPVKSGEAALFMESTGFAAMFSLTNNRHRLIGSINENQQNDSNITIDNALKIFKNRTHLFHLNIHDINWLSVYHSHHRRINKFRYQKQYFLLGDAAHIHSPVGGQGMNTGLQDAHNLGWKLGYVLTYSANDSLLDTYHDERSLVAKTLVHTTDKAFSFVTSSHWFIRFSRLYIVPYLLKFIIQPIFNYSYKIQQSLFYRLSQLGINYRSAISCVYDASTGNFQQSTPSPGDRFPYVIFDPCFYHLITFENDDSTKFTLFIDFIQRNYSKIIKIHNTHEENIPFRFQGAILVRPDGYIAYRTLTYDINHFHCYLKQYFPYQLI